MPPPSAPESVVTQAPMLAEVLAGWPTDRPLALCRAGHASGTVRRGPRWTLLASPERVTPIGSPSDLDEVLAARKPGAEVRSRDAPPFRSGRLLALSYHLGRALEPAAGDRPFNGPLGFALGCPGVLAFDHERNEWTRWGDPDAALPHPAGFRAVTPSLASTLGPLASESGRRGYTDAVRRALDLIAAGDVYQVNLAHRLAAPFAGSPRAFMGELLASADPLHAFYAEVPGEGAATRSICSASPELFLSYDPATRRVRTSPMKGTRPIGGDAEELRTAEKDRAELNMITDLMRNDLGRACSFGSVRVDRARTIESHADSVLQATSTVSGTVREGLTPADLVRATFPPGSVTGAPKVRAMQIIDELETSPRGFYCGALGWLDDSGAMSLNVAIRTATIEGGRLTYHAGAGIVADSDPDAEWAETMGKADVVARLAASPSGS